MRPHYRALMLAAGVGARLSTSKAHPPKALLRIGGKSLLERHIEILRSCGIAELVIAVGYERRQIEDELAAIGASGFARTVLNRRFRKGSLVSLWALRRELLQGGDVVLMDADVLYDRRLMLRLIDSVERNCFLLDRDFEAGDEPVKLCVREGRLVDFGKRVDASADFRGESVGFFRFSPSVSRRLVEAMARYVAAGRLDEPYEEAIRELVKAPAADRFGWEDISGLPWIEIDFPQDAKRAREEILPRLVDIPAGADERFRGRGTAAAASAGGPAEP